ncbi:MAG: hypothetical protein ABIH90_00525, partial [Candidatus Aenigmatarchaeota archaeon]
MKRERVREWLRKYNTEQIKFTKKAELRCGQRNIKKTLIEQNISNPENLIKVDDEGEVSYKEYKFRVAFKISNARTLVVR